MGHDTPFPRPLTVPAAAGRGLGLPATDGEPPGLRDSDEPGYYDVPMLKPPVWKGLVTWYLFLGGLSGGAFVTARLAERFGGPRFRRVATVGTGVAALAAVPCGPLLIADLGDPKRFHHMLRVFKPHSPMNLGSWTLTGFYAAGAAAVVREWLRWGMSYDELADRGGLARVVDGLLAAVTDLAGVPLALLLSCYTGVLLTGASIPVWCKSIWLPALFSASAMSSGSGAVSLALNALDAAGVEVGADAAERPLKSLNTVAHLAEAATLVGYLSSLAGRSLTAGPLGTRAWGTLAALAGSEVVKHLPAGRRSRRWLAIGAAAVGVFAAYHLRSTLVRAGHASANDPRARH